MVFVLIGVVLVVCNLLDVGPMGAWNWQISGDLWKFVLPFVLAIGVVDLVGRSAAGPSARP